MSRGPQPVRVGTAIVGAVGSGLITVGSLLLSLAWAEATAIDGDADRDAELMVQAGLGAALAFLLDGVLLAVGRKDL